MDRQKLPTVAAREVPGWHSIKAKSAWLDDHTGSLALALVLLLAAAGALWRVLSWAAGKWPRFRDVASHFRRFAGSPPTTSGS